MSALNPDTIPDLTRLADLGHDWCCVGHNHAGRPYWHGDLADNDVLAAYLAMRNDSLITQVSVRIKPHHYALMARITPLVPVERAWRAAAQPKHNPRCGQVGAR